MKTVPLTHDKAYLAISMLEQLTSKRSDKEVRDEAVTALRTTREKLTTPQGSALWQVFREAYLGLRREGFTPVRSGSEAARILNECVQEVKAQKLADDLEWEMY